MSRAGLYNSAISSSFLHLLFLFRNSSVSRPLVSPIALSSSLSPRSTLRCRAAFTTSARALFLSDAISLSPHVISAAFRESGRYKNSHGSFALANRTDWFRVLLTCFSRKCSRSAGGQSLEAITAERWLRPPLQDGKENIGESRSSRR